MSEELNDEFDLDESKNDTSSSNLSDFDKFRFAGLNPRRKSNKYYGMNRVGNDRCVVKVSESHIFESKYGYGLILDDKHVCWLKAWQVSQSVYGTEVLLDKKYFQPKEWGYHPEFGIIEENYIFENWEATAKEQQEAGTNVYWKVDGATRMLESFKKQAEKRKRIRSVHSAEYIKERKEELMDLLSKAKTDEERDLLIKAYDVTINPYQ